MSTSGDHQGDNTDGAQPRNGSDSEGGDEQQLAFLHANGCDQIQGYYFSSALVAADCTAFLESGRQLQRPTLDTPDEPGVLLTADIRRGLSAALEAGTQAPVARSRRRG